MQSNKLGEYRSLYLKSILIGSSFIIPGISAGTLAFIFGIYTLVLDSILGLWGPKFKRSSQVLLTVTMGSLTGLGLFVFLMNCFIFPYPCVTAIVFSLFSGFVLGALSLIRQLREQTFCLRQRLVTYILALAGFALVLVIFLYCSPIHKVSVSYDKTMLESPRFMFILFWAIFFASGFMLLPGISGSAILLSLGLYAPTLFILKNFLTYPLLTIVLGTLAGIFLWGAVIRYFLYNYKNYTYFFVSGLILGSSIQILTSAFYLCDTKQPLNLLLLAVMFFVGWVSSRLTNKISRKSN